MIGSGELTNKKLRIAYVLLTATRPLSTQELVDLTGAERKTIYQAIDALEDAGFITTKERKSDGSRRIYNYYSCKLRCE